MNKKHLSTQIGRELEAAGFRRTGRYWELDTGKVLWLVFFAHDSEDASVYLSIAAFPSGWDTDRGGYLINEPLHQLVPGTSGPNTLTNGASPHPLVMDTRDVFVPLVGRLETPAAILDARLEGELGDPHRPVSDRIAVGYSRAASVGSRRHQERAQEIALRKGWTDEDRFSFAEGGLQVNGPTREPAFVVSLPRTFTVSGNTAGDAAASEYSWNGRRWAEGPPKVEHWLTIELHDGDIAHVRFRENAATEWESAWLGTLPELWFGDPRLTQDHDFAATARALTARVHRASGVAIDGDLVERLLAAAATEEPLHDFVEETLEELLEILGLPELP